MILPNARAALLTVFLFSLVWYWNDYFFTSTFMQDTVTVSVQLTKPVSYTHLENDPRDLNTAVLLASTIGLFVLWSLSNYLFCTLHDGKGFFKEIWCASAYALLPYTLLTFLVTAASNFVVLEEYAILRYLGVAGICLLYTSISPSTAAARC